MARRNLAYYGGQYDPSDYYQDIQPAGVISMYNPQSQAQFIDAVAKRQERFDAGKLSQAQEIARIAETETYDMAELTKRLKSFEDTVNSTVKDKYNGDYSAAANEIAKMIGTERTNPFYHFNKQKVEMGKAYLDAKMKLGANFMSSGNPFDVSFQDWQSGKTFEFTPINSADITQRSASLFKNFANKLMGDSGLMNSPEGQYFRTVQQYGFQSPEEAMAYAEKTGLLDQLYESMPELAGVENQEAVMNAIYQGASYGVGTTKVDYLANRGFDATGGSGNSSDIGTSLIYEKGAIDVDSNLAKAIGPGPDGKPIALQTFAIQEIVPSMLNQKGIGQIKAIRDWVNEYSAGLITGPKINPGIEFSSRRDRKAAEQMVDDIKITNFGFNPTKPQIVVSLSGLNREDKKVESTAILNARDNDIPRSEILQLVTGFYQLAAPAGPNSEFIKLANEWYRKFFSETLE